MVTVTAAAEQLGELHAALERFWSTADQSLAQPPEEVWRLRFATAVLEIGANITRHAYPPDADPRVMRLRLRAFTDRVEARFTDCGTEASIPEESAEPSLDELLDVPESGYGLTIARVVLDRLSYRRTRNGANCWRLVKRFTPTA